MDRKDKTLAQYLDEINDIESSRQKKELEHCSIMLTDDELSEISSIRTGYRIARNRFIEEVLKETDPEYYNKIKTSDYKVPIFGIADMAREFRGNTED